MASEWYMRRLQGLRRRAEAYIVPGKKRDSELSTTAGNTTSMPTKPTRPGSTSTTRSSTKTSRRYGLTAESRGDFLQGKCVARAMVVWRAPRGPRRGEVAGATHGEVGGRGVGRSGWLRATRAVVWNTFVTVYRSAQRLPSKPIGQHSTHTHTHVNTLCSSVGKHMLCDFRFPRARKGSSATQKTWETKHNKPRTAQAPPPTSSQATRQRTHGRHAHIYTYTRRVYTCWFSRPWLLICSSINPPTCVRAYL